MNIQTMEITPDLLNFTPPKFSESQVLETVLNTYKLTGKLKALSGERDQNFRLTTEDNTQYVVKISAPNENTDVVDFQINALLYMEKSAAGLPVPRIIKSTTNSYVSKIRREDGIDHQMRLLSYLPGVSVGNDNPYTLDILRDIGRFQARTCKALTGYNHPASQNFMAWDASNGLVFNKSLHAQFSSSEQKQLATLLAPFLNGIFDRLKSLRHQIIHNDGHSWNILFESEDSLKITGIIDFGDIVHAPIINDLAVTAESFIRANNDFISAIGALASGFHEIIPLKSNEIELLHDIITLRGILVILLEGYRGKIISPPDQTLIDEMPEHWDFVERMNKISREDATNHYKSVCGF